MHSLSFGCFWGDARREARGGDRDGRETPELELKGFKAWVKFLFETYEWLSISLAKKPRTE